MNRIEGAAIARAAYTAKKRAAMSRYAALLESDPKLADSAAARELGVTRRTIQRWRAELGMTVRREFVMDDEARRERQRAYDREYRARNREALNAYARQWRRGHQA